MLILELCLVFSHQLSWDVSFYSSQISAVKVMLIGSWISQPHSPCPSIYGLSAISVHVNTNTTEYAGNKILASLSGFSLAAFINVFPVKLLSHWLSQFGESAVG